MICAKLRADSDSWAVWQAEVHVVLGGYQSRMHDIYELPLPTIGLCWEHARGSSAVHGYVGRVVNPLL